MSATLINPIKNWHLKMVLYWQTHLIFLRYLSLMLLGHQTSHDMKSTTTFLIPDVALLRNYWGSIVPYRNTGFLLLYILSMFTFSTWSRKTCVPSNLLYYRVNDNDKSKASTISRCKKLKLLSVLEVKRAF